MLTVLLYKRNSKGLGWFFFLNTKTANEYMKKITHHVQYL